MSLPGAKRFLFYLWPRHGHVNASLGLIRHLVDAGASVSVLSADPEFVADRLVRASLSSVRCIGAEASPAAAPRPVAARRAHVAEHLQDPRWRNLFFEVVLAAEKAAVPGIRAAIGAVAPDVFCNEASSVAGALAAELEGVTWAAVSSSIVLAAPPAYSCAMRDDFERWNPRRAELAADSGVGLSFHWSHVFSPHLNLVFSCEELTPIAPPLAAHTFLVGPVRLETTTVAAPFPRERLDPDRPLVYVSSGTELTFGPAIWRGLVDAALAEGAQVVLAAGDAAQHFATIETDVVVVPHAPQRELLERAALFVTHGGANSLVEAIDRGVPLLVIPLGFDQPLNAMFAERAGVGRALDPEPWDQARAADAVRGLLRDDAPERAKVRELQGALRSRDGSRAGADLLLDLAARARRPASRAP